MGNRNLELIERCVSAESYTNTRSKMYSKHLLRKRHRGWQVIILVSVCVLAYLTVLFPAMLFKSDLDELYEIESHSSRKLMADENTTDAGFNYPPDAFTKEQRQDGAVILHVIGLIYMFVALAIVCDEFFVPSLSVIIDKLKISEDVAGATFMAAGGSAPELFTSLIGVFFAKNNVGIGTIVGSAVFNILFVIGMCAIVSKTVLDLTWWPLFRDVTFYSLDLIALIVFFRDGDIEWWEALILLLMYISYVIFMKFNSQVESFVKSKLRRKARVHSDDSLLNEDTRSPTPTSLTPIPEKMMKYSNDCCMNKAHEKAHRKCSVPIIHSGTNHFRHGVLQLMIHTIDPISDSHIQEKAMHLHQVTRSNPTSEDSITNATNGDVKHNNSVTNGNVPDKNSNKKQTQVHVISNGHVPTDSPTRTDYGTQYASPIRSSCSPIPEDRVVSSPGNIQVQSSSTRASNNTEETIVETPQEDLDEKQEEDEDEPLDMSWPTTWRKRITYILLAPLIFPMWLTLPDTRRPEKRKWFLVSFFGSILWIAIFSYMMVWWANMIGEETIGIPSSIMGLTILAAGTSIPDLITSVIVAKKGLGDMAVSSSVGSNIFDITVGLPVPWLIYAAIYQGQAVNVDSNGLACSILLLFAMLITVVVTIAVAKWKMTKVMGACMLVLYCCFVVLSVLLELGIIECLLS